MTLQTLYHNFKWTLLMIVGILVSLGLLTVGFMVVVSLGSATLALGLKTLSRFIFAFNIIPGVVFMLGGFVAFWYVILKKAYEEGKFEERLVIGFSLLPIFGIVGLLYKPLFLAPRSSGCGIISPGVVFLCAVYSIVLFPVFVMGLKRWVLAVNEPLLKKNGIFKLAGYLGGLGILMIILTISIMGIHHFLTLLKA